MAAASILSSEIEFGMPELQNCSLRLLSQLANGADQCIDLVAQGIIQFGWIIIEQKKVASSCEKDKPAAVLGLA